MQVNYSEMVRRDPGLAALMGAISGASFGGVPQPSRGVQFGDDVGWGFGAAAPHHAPAHHAPAHHAPHAGHGHAHPAHSHSTENRTLLLDPNRHSTVKVERYSFSFSPTAALVLGTASNQGSYTQQPSASIKGERIVMNAPQENFVFVQSLQIANVNVIIGGQEDANTYSGRSQGVYLALPRLDPQNRATAASNYTGSLPPGFTGGASYTFVVTLQGPATLAGGYGQ